MYLFFFSIGCSGFFFFSLLSGLEVGQFPFLLFGLLEDLSAFFYMKYGSSGSLWCSALLVEIGILGSFSMLAPLYTPIIVGQKV